MKLCLLILSVLLVLTVPAFATSEGSSSNKTISVCRIEYTSAGKSPSWHFNYTYLVHTDAEGVVENVSELGNKKHPAFVNESAIVECMKTWKLLPSGQHVVLFSIGTRGGNYVSMVDPDHNVLKLVLP